MAILLFAQHDGGALNPATLHALTAAIEIGGDVDMLLVGAGLDSVAAEAAAIAGVRAVLTADHDRLANPVAEDVAEIIRAAADGYDYFMAAATTAGKNIMPRVAALLDSAQISDIVAVLGPDTFQRYVYAGNALATVKSTDTKRVITVRTTAFAAAPAQGGSASVTRIEPMTPSELVAFVGREVSKSERPDLSSAKIVVSGGRGMGSGENFAILETLADKLGAAVGASRAAVDAGYVPNDYQVGQTGKIVAPELYVAVGISGAIQHLAGMKDSKVIVAINKDEEAPIFQVADYGLVSDLFKAVPELTEAIERVKS